MRLTTKPGVSWHADGDLAQPLDRRERRLHRIVGRELRAHDLDQRHQGGRVEEVHAHDSLGRRGRRCDLGDGQGRRIAREHRVGAADRLELREERPLGVELLDDRLDHEVAVGERVELRRRAQAGDCVVPLLVGALPLLDLAREEMPDPTCGGLTELGRHLAADHVEARLHGDLRDPGAHRAEPDDTDPLHVHGAGIYPSRAPDRAAIRAAMRASASASPARAAARRAASSSSAA